MTSLPRLVRLAILDTYGVEWSLATFARDVVQNFFDVALSFREVSFERDEAARTLTIRGPTEFDLELLAYVGATTKLDGKTAGGFGEGFKICALVGVRDHGLAIRAGSGETEIEVVFEPVPLGRELCYRVRSAPGGKGSFVRLEGCTDAVFAAFETARHQFYHDDNPHLGMLIATDEGRTVAIHLAAPGEKHGEIYYRRQFRGDIDYSGHGASPTRLTVACHHAVDNLEGDRDRRILDPQSVTRAIGERLPPEGIQQALLFLMAEWPHGHDVLYGLVLAAIDRKLRFDWPDGWIARASPSGDQALIRAAERKGFKVAVTQFGQIGMKTVKDVLSLQKGKISVPTPAERARIDVAIALYGTLSGDEPSSQSWKVYDGHTAEAVHQHHNGRELFVASRLLEADGFVLGASAVLHELAHEFGAEDSAGFLNRLGRLVGGAIRDPAAVAAARAKFERALPKRRRVAVVEDVEPYKPEVVMRAPGAKRHAFYISVLVPPGFPPTTALVNRLHEGAAAAGYACYAAVSEVQNLWEARHHKVRGIPCVRLGETEEVDPSGASGRYGLRLRTYGPDRDILPSVEMVAAAFHAYMAEISARISVGQTLEQQLYYRDIGASHQCSDWAKAMAKGPWREQLESALNHACVVHLESVKKGIEQTHEELSAVVQADVLRMKQAADAHLAAQTDFDPGDGFEEEALRFAHTVFMAGLAAGSAERAARDFAVVREAAKALLAVDLGSEIREGVLTWCLERAGAKAQYRGAKLKPLDETAFRASFTTALVEAQRIQHALDRDERGLRWHELNRRLDDAMRTPSEREEERVKRLAQSAWSERFMRHRRMRAALTHTIKETWERTLAETGSDATAGEACIALLRRLDNEITAEERRVKKGAA